MMEDNLRLVRSNCVHRGTEDEIKIAIYEGFGYEVTIREYIGIKSYSFFPKRTKYQPDIQYSDNGGTINFDSPYSVMSASVEDIEDVVENIRDAKKLIECLGKIN